MRKIIDDHTPTKTNMILSEFMKRAFIEISDKAGRNANNQATINHGIQACALRYMRKKGVKTNELYPNINH